MSDAIRLYMFDGGITHLSLRNFTLGKGGNGEMITAPTPYFVITHPRGNAIIDGGNAPEVAVDAAKHWVAITEISTPVMRPEQAVLPSLERVGWGERRARRVHGVGVRHRALAEPPATARLAAQRDGRHRSRPGAVADFRRAPECYA